MDARTEEIKQAATTLLAGMLSNPHIYSQTSNEGGDGQMEHRLIVLAVEMAESLVQYIEINHKKALE
jgi:hypothetical protein